MRIHPMMCQVSDSGCFREVCQDVFTNPRTVPTVKKVKYCTRPGEADISSNARAADAPERQSQRPGGQRPTQSLVPPPQQEIQVRGNLESVTLQYICVSQALRQALALQQQQMAELISFQQQQQQQLQQQRKQQTQSQNRNSVFGRDNRNQKLRQSNFGNQNLRNGKATKSSKKNAKNLSVFGKSGKQNPHQQQREEFLRQRALRLLNLHK